MGSTLSSIQGNGEGTAVAQDTTTADYVLNTSNPFLKESLFMDDFSNDNTTEWADSRGAWWWVPGHIPFPRSSEAPAPAPTPTLTPAPTMCLERLEAMSSMSSGLFSSVEGMHVVGDNSIDFNCNDDDDDSAAVWVYQLNHLHLWAEVVAGSFMVLTLLLMINQIGLHLTYNEHQGFRTYTVRILLMVPIYSVTSYCGLHNPANAVTFALIRDCYECVVLFSFLQYCLTYLGGPENLARYLQVKQKDADAVLNSLATPPLTKARSEEGAATTTAKAGEERKKMEAKQAKAPRTHQQHPPLCWLVCPCAPVWRSNCDCCCPPPSTNQSSFSPSSSSSPSSPSSSCGSCCTVIRSRPWALGGEFVRLTLLGTLQYIPFSLLVTIASVVGKHYGRYHEGRFARDDVYLYAIVVRNWSQCWALYCLGLVYVCLHDELKGMKPLLKFSAIKLVVLFMWWQGVFVNVLEQSPQMKEADDGLLKQGWTSKEVGFCINNFLCIVEMFFIGVLMHYAFHYTEWASPEVAEANRGVSPLKALRRSKAVSAATAVTRDVAGLGVAGAKAAGQGMRYAVQQGGSPTKKGGVVRRGGASADEAEGRNTRDDEEYDEESEQRAARGRRKFFKKMAGEFERVPTNDDDEEEGCLDEAGHSSIDDHDKVLRRPPSRGGDGLGDYSEDDERLLPATGRSRRDGKPDNRGNHGNDDSHASSHPDKPAFMRLRSLPHLKVTKSERTAATRLFTEGVNFMDIFKALWEINGLERALAAEQAEEDKDDEENAKDEEPAVEEEEEEEALGERAFLRGGRGGRRREGEDEEIFNGGRILPWKQHKTHSPSPPLNRDSGRRHYTTPPSPPPAPDPLPAVAAAVEPPNFGNGVKDRGDTPRIPLDLPPGLSARQKALAMGYVAPTAEEVLKGHLQPTSSDNVNETSNSVYAYAASADDDDDDARYADADFIDDDDERAFGADEERGMSSSVGRDAARWSDGAVASDFRPDANQLNDFDDEVNADTSGKEGSRGGARMGDVSVVYVQPLSGSPLEVPIGTSFNASITVFELKVKVSALLGYVPARLTLTDAATKCLLKNADVVYANERLCMAVDVGPAAHTAGAGTAVTPSSDAASKAEGVSSSEVTGALASRFVAPTSFRR